VSRVDPAAQSEASELSTVSKQLGQLLSLLAGKAAGTDAAAPAAAAPEPAAPATPPPPVGTFVKNVTAVPGHDGTTTRYGLVVAADLEQNTAAVCWFPAEPTTLAGAELEAIE
jgi:hypothetical protein